jgi:hypothetical protein
LLDSSRELFDDFLLKLSRELLDDEDLASRELFDDLLPDSASNEQLLDILLDLPCELSDEVLFDPLSCGFSVDDWPALSFWRSSFSHFAISFAMLSLIDLISSSAFANMKSCLGLFLMTWAGIGATRGAVGRKSGSPLSPMKQECGGHTRFGWQVGTVLATTL